MTLDDIQALSDYHGLTPLPADFDEFWAERVAEADVVPLEWHVEPSTEIPASPVCDYLDLWFTGMGGAQLYAKYLRPKAAGPLPVVLQFHGYPGATRSWFEQSSFVGMGCAVIALDNPGQGGRSEDVGGFQGTTVAGHLVAGLDGEPRDLYYVRLYQDLRILCRIVRALGEAGELDLSRVFVNGASQGGGMGIACCALNADLINRAAILYPFLSDFRKVYELGADEIAYEGIRYYARWFDPDGTRADEWFGKLAYYETNHFAHLVRCPVLFGTGLEDTICPPETQCAVYNELSCPKRRFLYEGFGHEEIQAFDDLLLGFFGVALAGGARQSGSVPEGFEGGTQLYQALEDRSGVQELGNVAASYETFRLVLGEGRTLNARLVIPAGTADALVLMFHDLGRPGRGWFHLTRFAAAGCAVLQLENRADAGASDLVRMARDAADALEQVWTMLPPAKEHLVAFGEGFGGAVALTVARHLCLDKVVALNPYPLDDPSGLAERIACPVLLGTCGMDELADPAAQDRLASGLADVRHIHYPKYAHERVNAFENEFLAFLAGK